MIVPFRFRSVRIMKDWIEADGDFTRFELKPHIQFSQVVKCYEKEQPRAHSPLFVTAFVKKRAAQR